MNSKRVGRISEEIRKVVSSLIFKDLKDPRIDQLASITHVELSNDYSVAKIFVSTIDEKNLSDTVDGLNSAKGFIKREISKELKLRITPEITFVKDDSIAKSFELYEVLGQVKKED